MDGLWVARGSRSLCSRALWVGLSLLYLNASARAQPPVLHEYVPNVQPHEAVEALSPIAGQPSSIVYDGELLPAPSPAASRGSRPMRAGTGEGQGREQPGRRSPTFRPDRQTRLEERLVYDAGFSPTIAPFKRLTALDQVALDADKRTPVLRVHRQARRAMPIEGFPSAAAERRILDRFWGQATLDFSEGALLPLPSVAPDARILSVESHPATELRFERDGADNYYVTYVGRRPRGRVQLTFLTDAPRAYFGAPLPDVGTDVLASEVPPMPASVRRRALELARALGLHPQDRLPHVVATLTEHFRGFEEAPSPPEDTGDMLRDLVQGKKGVCRHRSYGFVVLAQALGIPARFVQNEAHAWVEVKLPGTGWMRIDLGGAAAGLEARGAQDRPLYQPAYVDDLPRPPAYERSYSQLQGSVHGLRARDLESITGRWLLRDPSAGSGGEAAAVLGAPTDRPGMPGAGTDRRPLLVDVDQRRTQVRRGALMKVTGRILDASGNGVAGLRVEVSLGARDERRTLLLGVSVTDAQGRYAANLGVPPDLPAGDYRLLVITPGNAQYGPAMAD